MNLTITAEARTDAELVQAARQQESGAYGALFRRWYDRSYEVALNLGCDPEAAADVAQDAFLVGWQRLMDLRDPNAFGGWILRTTRNRALNRVTRSTSGSPARSGGISGTATRERLFASMPFVVAPSLFKERASAALAQAGVPMAPPVTVAVAASPVPSGPPQGGGQVAAVWGAAAVALAVLAAVVLWPAGPDRNLSAADERSVTALPSVGAPTTDSSATVPVTVPNQVLVTATTPPDAVISHAPRKMTPTKKPTHAPTATVPGRGPAPGLSTGSPTPLQPVAGGGCRHGLIPILRRWLPLPDLCLLRP